MSARLTLSVPQAGEWLGISRGSAYAAAREGRIPTLRFGDRVVVPIPKLLELVGGTAGLDPELLRSLGLAPADDQAGDASGPDSPSHEPDPNDALAKGSPDHGRTPTQPKPAERHLTGL